MFSVTECGCQRPRSKPKIKSKRSLILQLGLVIERYVESDTWTQMVKKRQFLTFLPVRSSRTDHRHPDLVVFLDIGKWTKKKCHHFNKQLAQGCSKLNRTYLEVLVLLPVILHFATKLFVAVAKCSASRNAGASGLQANQKSNQSGHSYCSWVLL